MLHVPDVVVVNIVACTHVHVRCFVFVDFDKDNKQMSFYSFNMIMTGELVSIVSTRIHTRYTLCICNIIYIGDASLVICSLNHREFGARVFNVKTLLKATPGVFEHSDKNVRAEVGYSLVYRSWPN